SESQEGNRSRGRRQNVSSSVPLPCHFSQIYHMKGVLSTERGYSRVQIIQLLLKSATGSVVHEVSPVGDSNMSGRSHKNITVRKNDKLQLIKIQIRESVGIYKS